MEKVTQFQKAHQIWLELDGQDYAERWSLWLHTFYFAQKAKSMGNNLPIGSMNLLETLSGATK